MKATYGTVSATATWPTWCTFHCHLPVWSGKTLSRSAPDWLCTTHVIVSTGAPAEDCGAALKR